MMKKPIFLLGFMASGKTKLAKKLANSLQLPFIDLDQEIENKNKKSITQLFQEQGESRFREIESSTLRALPIDSASIISLGGGTPCSDENIEYINSVGVSVYLNTSTSILIGRLKMNKADRPLVANLSDGELGDYVKTKLAEREIFYLKSNLILTPESQSISEILELLNGV